jgi:hypothetical protein
MIWWMLACAEPDPDVETGFAIVGVSPEDGAADVVEAHIPELRFSDPADPDTCTAETLRLDGIVDDGAVAFSVPVEIVPLDGGLRVQLTHADPLPRGWSYALSARAGDDDGCLDVDGNVLRPFASSFAVP